MVTKRLQYRYDAMGNKVGMTDPDGGVFTYTYDVMRRLTGVINPQNERTTYTYNLSGRRTSMQLANGTRTSYSYDVNSRVQQVHTLKSDGSTIAKFDYSYDDNGRRTSVVEADGSRVTWTYDRCSQVTGEWRTGTSPYRHTFTYDVCGNRTLKIENGARTTLVYDAANQLLSSVDSSGTTNFTYDGNGNQVATQAPNGDRTTQVWDYENHLVRNIQTSLAVASMTYDADGLRMKKETSAETKLFVWDNQNYLQETDAAGALEVAYTMEPSTYGSTISHQKAGITTYYHFDTLSATRALTDSSEAVLAQYSYTAFGTLLDTPTLFTPLLWGGLVGYYWDADIGSNYIRARYYRPIIARWLSTDPIGLAGGDANMYRYVKNRTSLMLDPSGLWNEAGHFYTIYIIAKACGISTEDAFWYAYYAQQTDEIHAYDAYYVQKGQVVGDVSLDNCIGCNSAFINSSQWRDMVHKFLHALHGGDAEYILCFRQSVNELIQEKLQSRQYSDKQLAGILLHLLGDTYSHVRGRNQKAYPPVDGHAPFNDPDMITWRIFDGTYQEYIDNLQALFGGNCDQAVIKALLNGINDLRNDLHKKKVYDSKDRIEPENNFMRNFVPPNGKAYEWGYDPASKVSVLPGHIVEFQAVLDLITEIAKRCKKCDIPRQ